MENKDYLVMKDIYKSFSSVAVLKGVSFAVQRGEVHGLLGGNGAGKSTLMNILGGIYSKDKGNIYIDGKETDIQSPTQAIQNGIAFIHQELKLFSMRSVADNIFMSRLPVKGPFRFIDENKKNQEARRWLSLIELDIDPKTHVEKLSIAERQMVEIAKALSYESQIIIFDEPTSSLTKKETQTLFRIIGKLRDAGTCIIYISHKFEEIFELCDRVTVLRDGKNVGVVRTNETTTDELVGMVIGVRLEQYYPVVPPLETQNVLMKVENFVNRKLKGISFELREGEILGIFGLVGAGRSELARAMFGLDWLMTGDMFIREEKVRINSPRSAMRHGISFLTEDRRGEGLVLSMHVENNLNLPILNSIAAPVFNLLSRSKMKKNTSEAIKRFNIIAKNPRQLSKQLSGGNQQKVVFGKWRLTNPWVFILDEPTRGIDIKAKAEIYEQIAGMSKEGRASVVISSEAPELLGICHRILVMREGKMCGWFAREEATEEKLVKIAMGGG